MGQSHQVAEEEVNEISEDISEELKLLGMEDAATMKEDITSREEKTCRIGLLQPFKKTMKYFRQVARRPFQILCII